MYDAFVVGILQGLADLRHDGQGFFSRELAAVQHLPQVQAVHEFHEKVVEAGRASLSRREGRGGLPEIVYGNNVRMAEHSHGAGFAGEAVGEGWIFADRGREDFQRHEAVEPLLARLVDDAHPAAADQRQDFQVRKKRGQLLRRRRRASGRAGQAIFAARCLCFQPSLQQASRTKSLRSVGRQLRAALRTSIHLGHGCAVSLSLR